MSEEYEIPLAKDVYMKIKNMETENASRCKKLVGERIRDAVDDGNYCVSIDVDNKDGDIVKPILDYLHSRGYKVEHQTGVQWDPCNYYTISWDL